MVVKRVVLLGIEHLEKRRRWITTKIGRHLVDFIEQEHGIVCPGLLEALDQFARERTDVRTTMPANLGFITHTAQGQTDKLATRGARDALRKAGFTDARRTNETKNRALELLRQGLHGEIFEDAFLDLFEPVMIFIEDVFRLDEVMTFFALFVPRQVENPVDVVANDGRFRARRMHHLELLEFFFDL